jgi:hypothetical protein
MHARVGSVRFAAGAPPPEQAAVAQTMPHLAPVLDQAGGAEDEGPLANGPGAGNDALIHETPQACHLRRRASKGRAS